MISSAKVLIGSMNMNDLNVIKNVIDIEKHN